MHEIAAPHSPYMAAPLPLNNQEFIRISNIVRSQTGIDLKQGREQLVVSRLSKFLRQEGFSNFSAYLGWVERDGSGQRLSALVDALTTNHTSFLREPAHFQFLREHILPVWKRTQPLTLWSAACSSGEEPCTIVCTLLDALGTASSKEFTILASDISTRMLAEASAAAYPMKRCGSLPQAWQQQYFNTTQSGNETTCSLKDSPRQFLRFQKINLADTLPLTSQFDVIFCRNVLIYFDRDMQEQIVCRLSNQLCPGGYLFVGHAESLSSLKHPLQFVQPAVYRRS